MEWEMPRGYMPVTSCYNMEFSRKNTSLGILTQKGNQINFLLLHYWNKLEVRVILFSFSSSDRERACTAVPPQIEKVGYQNDL